MAAGRYRRGPRARRRRRRTLAGRGEAGAGSCGPVSPWRGIRVRRLRPARTRCPALLHQQALRAGLPGLGSADTDRRAGRSRPAIPLRRHACAGHGGLPPARRADDRTVRHATTRQHPHGADSLRRSGPADAARRHRADRRCGGHGVAADGRRHPCRTEARRDGGTQPGPLPVGTRRAGCGVAAAGPGVCVQARPAMGLRPRAVRCSGEPAVGGTSDATRRRATLLPPARRSAPAPAAGD